MSKVNWSKLKKLYISDETVSFMDLSEKFKVSNSAISMKAAKEGWTALRKETREKLDSKLVESVGNGLAEYQKKKYNIGQYLADKGLVTIRDTKEVITPRLGKEMIEAGYKLSDEVMGLNKPNQINIQNVGGEMNLEFVGKNE